MTTNLALSSAERRRLFSHGQAQSPLMRESRNLEAAKYAAHFAHRASLFLRFLTSQTTSEISSLAALENPPAAEPARTMTPSNRLARQFGRPAAFNFRLLRLRLRDSGLQPPHSLIALEKDASLAQNTRASSALLERRSPMTHAPSVFTRPASSARRRKVI